MTGTIRIALVDDHVLLRDVLRSQLQNEPDMEVVGVGSTGEEAVHLAQDHGPDVLLLDIDMPGKLCFVAAREVKARFPETRIVFLSAFSHDRYIEDALSAQATGYLTKDEPPEVLLEAIRRAASGRAYFSPRVQSRLVVDSKRIRLKSAGMSRASLLTQRELETIRYIAQGLANKEIAIKMCVTVKTVDRHTQNAMDKLAIHNRVALARFAIREGLAEP